MENIFKKMVELQHSFNTQTAGEDYLEKDLPWTSAIIVKSGKLLENYGYQWWEKQEQNLTKAKVDAVSLLSLVISDYLSINYLWCEDTGVKELFLQETTASFEKYFTCEEITGNSLLDLVDMLNCEDYDRFETLKQIFNRLDMSNEDLFIALDTYHKENEKMHIDKNEHNLAITVVKDCGTCSFLAFDDGLLEDNPSGRCTLTNEIVTMESDEGIIYKQIECGNWTIDKRLFEDTEHFIKKIDGELLV